MCSPGWMRSSQGWRSSTSGSRCAMSDARDERGTDERSPEVREAERIAERVEDEGIVDQQAAILDDVARAQEDEVG